MNTLTQELILLPVVFLAFWTMLVLLLVPYSRFKAVFKGDLIRDDFKRGDSEGLPDYVTLPNRNFMNLLEVPVLFYLVCITFYIVEITSSTVLALAWVYVGLRILHSVCHLTYNGVIHRLSLYAASNFTLVALLVFLAIPLLQLTGLTA